MRCFAFFLVDYADERTDVHGYIEAEIIVRGGGGKKPEFLALSGIQSAGTTGTEFDGPEVVGIRSRGGFGPGAAGGEDCEQQSEGSGGKVWYFAAEKINFKNCHLFQPT